MANTPSNIVIHHTASNRDSTSVPQIDAWHKARWPGFVSRLGFHVGYHKVITSNGSVTTTRHDDEVGAHARTADNMNAKSIGIVLTGNFEIEQPTNAQLQSLEQLINEYRAKYQIPNDRLLPHRHVSSTACPGASLVDWISQYKINNPQIPHSGSGGSANTTLTKEEVRYRYLVAFNRLPDAGEENFWTGKPSLELDKAIVRDRGNLMQQHS